MSTILLLGDLIQINGGLATCLLYSRWPEAGTEWYDCVIMTTFPPNP